MPRCVSDTGRRIGNQVRILSDPVTVIRGLRPIHCTRRRIGARGYEKGLRDDACKPGDLLKSPQCFLVEHNCAMTWIFIYTVTLLFAAGKHRAVGRHFYFAV